MLNLRGSNSIGWGPLFAPTQIELITTPSSLSTHLPPRSPHRIRPIDKRLQYQIERLIKAAQIAKRQEAQLKGGKGEALDQDAVVEDEDEGDASRFGPRREMLGAKGAPGGGKTPGGRSGSSAAEDGKPGIYRPPKINPVSMEEWVLTDIGG